jgi:hypothetical protein
MTSDLILGLDVSTTCVGICILSDNEGVVYLDNVDLSKTKSFNDKCDAVENRLMPFQGRISKFFIEECAKAFRPGLSSANTLTALSRFNGAVSCICHRLFGGDENLVNPVVARKSVGIQINYKDKSKTTKDKIYEVVSSRISFDWPRTKTGAVKPQCYDMADAYVVAMHGLKNCQ